MSLIEAESWVRIARKIGLPENSLKNEVFRTVEQAAHEWPALLDDLRLGASARSACADVGRHLR